MRHFSDWENNLQQRIANPAADDEIAAEILEGQRMTKNDVW